MKSRLCLLLGFVLFFIQYGSFGQSKRVCFTIDDLPVVGYGMLDQATQRKLTERLIGALKNNNIPAIGFVNESKLYGQDNLLLFQYQMLKSWVENGLELGNHSYSHFDYNNTSFADFSRDIIKGEAVTKKLQDDNGRSVKYFRHPYLHVGNTREKADSLDVFLAENGYTVAPVTIDNEEYIFAYAYHKAWLANDQQMMSKIAGDYITYMENMLRYYEIQSVRLFGQNISHILLLHANLLNADSLEALAGMFKKNGYEFIGLEQALKDELYQTPVTHFGDWGISWIDRWALSMGKKGSFFEDEPSTPAYIKELAGL